METVKNYHAEQRQVSKLLKLKEENARHKADEAVKARSVSERRVAELERELAVAQRVTDSERHRADQAAKDLLEYKEKIIDNTNQISILNATVDELQNKLASIDIEGIKDKAVTEFVDTKMKDALEAAFATGYKKGRDDGFSDGEDEGRKDGFSEAIAKAKALAPGLAMNLDELVLSEVSSGYTPSPDRDENRDEVRQVVADSAAHQEVDQPLPNVGLEAEALRDVAHRADDEGGDQTDSAAIVTVPVEEYPCTVATEGALTDVGQD